MLCSIAARTSARARSGRGPAARAAQPNAVRTRFDACSTGTRTGPLFPYSRARRTSRILRHPWSAPSPCVGPLPPIRLDKPDVSLIRPASGVVTPQTRRRRSSLPLRSTSRAPVGHSFEGAITKGTRSIRNSWSSRLRGQQSGSRRGCSGSRLRFRSPLPPLSGSRSSVFRPPPTGFFSGSPSG